MSTDGSTHPTESGSAGPLPHDPSYAAAGATPAGATSAGPADGTSVFGADGTTGHGPDGTPTYGTDGTATYGAPGTVTDGTIGDGTPAGEPGWVARNTNALISALLVVIVAALAIAAVVLYRNHEDDENTATETAATAFITNQGGEVETIDCHGDTCSAVVKGQAYTVLVQEDASGGQHFGISPYSG
jgi:hypothetical protein